MDMMGAVEGWLVATLVVRFEWWFCERWR